MRPKNSLNLKRSITSTNELTKQSPWRILVVDDEVDVHSVTQLILDDVKFKNRSIEILSAYSAADARKLLAIEKNIAVILLDVVMESDDAGLQLVKFIRDELQDKNIRIILRTGQPGQAPEESVIVDYDINDYKAKSELTAQKLFTTVITSLRAYEAMISLDTHIASLSKNREGLEKIIASTDTLFQVNSMTEFASGVLTQISSFLGCQPDGILCIEELLDADSMNETPHCVMKIIAAAGYYSECLSYVLDKLCKHKEIEQLVLRAMRERKNYFDEKYAVLYLETNDQKATVVLLNNGRTIDENDQKLLAVFTSKISIALANAVNYQKMISFEEAATTDFLTGLNNRRQLLRLGIPLVASAHRNQDISFAVAMLDIDFFKRVNDTYGHDIGDLVLKEVSLLLQQRFRASDIVSRYGGEEFCVIATQLNKVNAFKLFDDFRDALAHKTITLLTGENLKITMSIGVTMLLRHTLDDMVADADHLLYKAKENGRNCVVISA